MAKPDKSLQNLRRQLDLIRAVANGNFPKTSLELLAQRHDGLVVFTKLGNSLVAWEQVVAIRRVGEIAQLIALVHPHLLFRDADGELERVRIPDIRALRQIRDNPHGRALSIDEVVKLQVPERLLGLLKPGYGPTLADVLEKNALRRRQTAEPSGIEISPGFFVELL